MDVGKQLFSLICVTGFEWSAKATRQRSVLRLFQKGILPNERVPHVVF
jgi:hypothetical protein